MSQLCPDAELHLVQLPTCLLQTSTSKDLACVQLYDDNILVVSLRNHPAPEGILMAFDDLIRSREAGRNSD